MILLGLLVLGGLIVFRMAKPSNQSGARVPSGTRLEPHTASEWYERGNDLLRSGDHGAAAAAYEKAIALSPSWAEAHYGLGCALLELDDAEGAVAELESALSLAPAAASWRRNAENALVAAHLRMPRESAR